MDLYYYYDCRPTKGLLTEQVPQQNEIVADWENLLLEDNEMEELFC